MSDAGENLKINGEESDPSMMNSNPIKSVARNWRKSLLRNFVSSKNNNSKLENYQSLWSPLSVNETDLQKTLRHAFNSMRRCKATSEDCKTMWILRMKKFAH
eukprot:PhF_6_TR10038/c0_g1_i1/m.15420